jgi:hypothetical protein
MNDDEVKERLRLKYIPQTEGFDAEEIEAYDRFLALSGDEQRLHLADQDDDEFEMYVQLIKSRAMYTTPADRNPGSITPAKVDACPEPYRWWHR